jgi:hypothetical protein
MSHFDSYCFLSVSHALPETSGVAGVRDVCVRWEVGEVEKLVEVELRPVISTSSPRPHC